ncbi:MAG: alkaline phosphatase [Candidatus Ornithomonoglobus sp.]
MKSKIASALSLLLALLVALSFTGCVGNAASSNEVACTEHQWLAASCTLPKTCIKCGATEGEKQADAHAYTLTAHEESSCTEDGCNTYTCVYCGNIRNETIAACGHVHGADTCPVCGETGLNIIKNVILIIGDGMGLEHIAAGQGTYEKDYAFTDWQFATVNTDSLTSGGRNASELTDSAASGTALATGTITLNKYVGMDQHDRPLQTVLDYAKSLGKRTGIVTTDNLYGATPGAFSAHVSDRSDYQGILESQLSSNVDLLCGAVSGSNSLSRALVVQNGYTFCTTTSDMNSATDKDKLYCTLDMEGFNSSAAAVKLADATVAALNFLDNDAGFVMMIEQAHIDKYSHKKDFANMVASVDSLNSTVDAILDWLGDRTDTAIIVTADHETGELSFSLNDTLPSAYAVKGHQRVYYRFNSTSHTKSDVGFFLYGADIDIEKFSYFMTDYQLKNADIPAIIRCLMKNGR